MKIPRFRKAMNEKQQLHNIRRAKLAENRLLKEFDAKGGPEAWKKYVKDYQLLSKRVFKSYYDPVPKK